MNCPHCNTDIPVNGETSDGYHTFNELYDHRIELWISLCSIYTSKCDRDDVDPEVWRAKLHSDGTGLDGWFLLGIGKRNGEQLTYHLPIRYWDRCDIWETLDRAPAYDGHTSQDVMERLRKL